MNKELLYQNKKIFYRITGSGKPVMLIHGFGEDGNIWNNQVEYLKDKFQFIIPDLPGSGKSEMINDMSMEGMAEEPPQTPHKEGLSNTQPSLIENSLLKEKFCFIIPDLPGSGKSEMIDDMSMEGMADMIMTLLNTECSKAPPCEVPDPAEKAGEGKERSSGEASSSGGFRGAIVIGHSMGGYITLAFSEKYPGYLNAFGLFHSTAYEDSEEKKAARRKGIEFVNEHGAKAFLKTTIPNLFSMKTKDEKPELIDEQLAGLDNFSAPAIVSYYEAMMQRPDRTEILQKATVPVLFIMGKYDTTIPLQDGLQQCHLPEKSYIHILRNSGHMGMLEEKEKCNEILENFLREIWSKEPPSEN